MQQAAPSSLLLACSLALAPFLAVSWEIKINDLDEKDVNKFQSNGYKCPTCFAVMGRKCNSDLKWCRADKLQCLEFSGIINTGLKDMAIEVKRCIQADLCKETVTYMSFPIANQSKNCRPAISSGTRIRPLPPIIFILFLEKLLY
ncbi:hypothetical protein JEQ12_016699 [Ovis aries]|uniref:Uncharacterized protein n=2 Tax=Ovis aries TaxID=9940 RepID=A0AC11BGG3_SHEEP|nr:hypothetical protein JEQ12_016699 [Ovis aries]